MIETKLNLDDIVSMHNVAEKFSQDERDFLGRTIVESFDRDRESRRQWEEKMEKATKIALQIVEQKTFPWPGAANVKFPLLTIACLQYHSRAYPALVDSPNIVKVQPSLNDPEGKLLQSSTRVEAHMNWQLTEEDENWEAETDKALLVQALMGCVFKKSYFDGGLKRNVSECVLPQDLVTSYYTKDLETSPRYTHILKWSKNTLVEKANQGILLDLDHAPINSMPADFGLLATLKDTSQGLSQPTQDTDQPYTILEHYHWLDLDGDGYKEPYISFVRYDTRQLLRTVPRFLPSGIKYDNVRGKTRLIRIEPEQYFTKLTFIPSPDGGFYGLGFGSLLGPLNESIDTSINQIFDAGTMHNAGGGFLGRGAKFKGGEVTFRPNEWKRVDSPGDDLRKSIVELPRREPSPVLFQLLSLLIDYGQRVAGAADIVQGQNPGQNTPAETSRNMVEQGMKVFSGIYKRTYRGMKEEFRKLYRLNELYLSDSQEFVNPKTGFAMTVLAQDYSLPSSKIRPVADPHYVSDSQRLMQAQALLQASMQNPGYDRYQVNKFYLQTLRIPAPDLFYPDPKGPRAVPPPPNPKLQIEQMKAQAKQMEAQMTMKVKLFELLEEHELNRAKIHKLEAEAAKALAEAGGVEAGHRIAAFEASIGAAKLQQEGTIKSIELLRNLIQQLKGPENDQGRIPGMAEPPRDEGVQSLPPTPAA